MKKPTVLKLWPLACAVFILNACQKETSSGNSEKLVTQNTDRSTGALPDDLTKLAKLPFIVSSGFSGNKDVASVVNLSNARSRPVKSGGDTTAPIASIISPTNGATISGTVNVDVSASDNVGVISVELNVDGNAIGTLTASPYSFSWNASNVADGAHTLTAKASDAAGNFSTSSVTVAKNTTITVVPPPSTLPSSLFLTMPPVGYQGGEFNCAVFATTYAARSVEQFYKTNASAYDYSSNIFSPEFVYNKIKFNDNCGSGASVTTALDYLKSTGVCLWQSMPYSYTNGCSLTPTNSQFSEAANYKISSYSWLYASDVNAIKTMIANKHVIITTVLTDQSFNNAGAGFIWTAYSGSKGLGHSVVICGYDDAKHAYKIMNSWGTTWGDSGYSWIDYDFFPYTGAGICYVITGT